jgi:hypothetical protein
MPTIVKNFRFRERGKYPVDWKAFTDGKSRRLVQGVDFFGKPNSCQTMAHINAATFGMTCRTSRDGDDVIVQFIKPTKKQTKA